MASSFKTLDLFGSGPHRFVPHIRGQHLVPYMALGSQVPGSFVLGEQELVIVVVGRLVAADDAALDTLLAAIQTELNAISTPGTLVDHHGRSYANVYFTRFEPEDRVDRGRAVSLGYTARFHRLNL
ncbi:MAG: hypothetical protein ACKVS8_09200 [Phycisphaerales bacterium]